MNQPTVKTIYTCFPGGRHKVLTMSYDDGQIHDRRLVEIFNKNGIKGTFHLNSGLMERDANRIRPEEIKTLYAGHEVSAHTYTHPTIERCPNPQVVQQVLLDRQHLEDACGYPVRGMSYPNGSVSEDIVGLLPYCGIEYSRTVVSTYDFKLPQNYLLWNPTCHHSQLGDLPDRFLELFKTQYLYIMYVWGHSYEFDRDGSWNIIEDFCAKMGGHEDIWYATNIEIVDYMNAAKNLRYTAACDKVYNPSAIPVWISVDGNIHKIDGGMTVQL